MRLVSQRERERERNKIKSLCVSRERGERKSQSRRETKGRVFVCTETDKESRKREMRGGRP